MAVSPTSRPLTTQYLDIVFKELDEVGVAVSLVGTRKQMLEKLVGYVEPIAEALVGTRPKVAAVRGDLQRAMHNARRVRPLAREASEAIWEMAAAVKKTKDLVKRQRLGDVEPLEKVYAFEVLNVWGYTKSETAALRQELRQVSRLLSDLGLSEMGGAVVLDEKRAKGKAFIYDGDFVSDPKRSLKENDVLEAVASKVWTEFFESRQRKMWERDKDTFSKAFISKAKGEAQSSDARARLQGTLERLASGRFAA